MLAAPMNDVRIYLNGLGRGRLTDSWQLVECGLLLPVTFPYLSPREKMAGRNATRLTVVPTALFLTLFAAFDFSVAIYLANFNQPFTFGLALPPQQRSRSTCVG